MELLQLQYFITAAETGSITRTAEKLHISQPSLSQTIRRLEEELGYPLFERTGRGSRLTAPGQEFYNRTAPAVRSILEAARPQEHPEVTGHINIGSYMPISVLLPCIRAFAEEHPQIRYSFFYLSDEKTYDRHKLDAVLMYNMSAAMGFNEKTPLISVEGALIVPAEKAKRATGETARGDTGETARGDTGKTTKGATGETARGDTGEKAKRATGESFDYMDTANLAAKPFISLIQGTGYETMFDNFYHQGWQPNIRYSTDSTFFKSELLEAGMGIGFSNHLLADSLNPTGRYTVINPGYPVVMIYLGWRSDRVLSEAAKLLKQYVAEWFREKQP